MNRPTVLVIEDEATLRRVLKDNYEMEGFRVNLAADGEEGLHRALAMAPDLDLVVLDIMMPRMNGYEVCRWIRREGMDVPIVMLTAKGQESEVVLGLDLGADDYVTKPFAVRELMARSRALLRRRQSEREQVFIFGPWRLDGGARRLWRGDEEVELTPKEFGVLMLLARRAGRALSREQILREVWGRDLFVTLRSVDRCVLTLRKKIETDPASPRWLQTVREVGYRLETEEVPALP